jgi:hypothetical protein
MLPLQPGRGNALDRLDFLGARRCLVQEGAHDHALDLGPEVARIDRQKLDIIRVGEKLAEGLVVDEWENVERCRLALRCGCVAQVTVMST